MTHPYVRRQSSPFLKRVLIPFWILRLLVLVVGLAIYGIALAALIILTSDDLKKYEIDYNTTIDISKAQALIGVIVGIQFICLILELVCIVKRCRRTLSPAFFLGANIVQSTFVVAMFILSMIGARTAGSVGVSVAILVIFLGFLIYSAVVYHQFRKGLLDAELGMGSQSKGSH